MTEATVREFAHVYRDAVKVEGTLEIRKPRDSASDFLRSLPKSTQDSSMNAPGISSDSDS